MPFKPAPGSSRRKSRNHGVLASLEIPFRVGGSAAFRHTRQMLVPRQGGVYLLHDLRGVLYVGATGNLNRRFHQHYWLTENELLAEAMRCPFGELMFSWLSVAERGQRIALERVLIGWLQPPCNRVIPTNSFNVGE